MTETLHKRRILIALFLALILRLAVYPLSGIEKPEYFEYGDIARNIVLGEGYALGHWLVDLPIVVPSAWMPPGQVLVIATFFASFGESALANHLIFLLNVLLGVGAVHLIGEITLLASGRSSTQLVAVFAAALFPPFISAAGTWGVASSVLFLNSLMIYTAMQLSRSISSGIGRGKRSIGFGMAGGILALFRAEAPLTLAFVLLAMLIIHRNKLQAAFTFASTSGVIMACVVAPWIIFNLVRFDTVILGSTSGGYNLWRGNNETATGGGWSSEGKLIYPSYEFQHEFKRAHAGRPPIEFERAYSGMLSDSAIRWIKENPLETIGLSAKKVVLIWIADWYHPSKIKYLYLVFQICAVAIAAVGLRAVLHGDKSDGLREWQWIAGAACLASTLITMVFFSLPRYQIFLVGLYFPLVAIGLESLIPRRILGKLVDTPAEAPETNSKS